MEELIGIAASTASGGIFGVFGTALGRVARYFERRQDLAHERLRWAHESDLLRLQAAARHAETEAEAAIAESQARWRGLDASVTADATLAPSYRWVNAVRGLTRPALTLLLWLITASVWLAADGSEQARIIETVTFAATAATLWWFGDRAAMRSDVSRLG